MNEEKYLTELAHKYGLLHYEISELASTVDDIFSDKFIELVKKYAEIFISIESEVFV